MSKPKCTTERMLQILDENVNSHWKKQKALLQQNIEFLNSTIAEYAKRQDDNKKIIDMLMQLLKNKQQSQCNNKEFQLLSLNNELRQQIISNKKIHEQIIEHYENQITILKEQIFQKHKQSVLNQQKFEVNIIALQSKLKSVDSQKIMLQTKIQQLLIKNQQFKQTQNYIQKELLNNFQITKRNSQKQKQLKDTSPIQSRTNSISDVFKTLIDDSENNINQMNRMERVRSYMKKGKGQIKLMMSTLIKTKGQLKEGQDNITYFLERESLTKTGSKASKSFYH